MTVTELRQKYPVFRYQSFEYQITGQGLEVLFRFSTEPDLVFHPHLIIPGVTREQIEAISLAKLEQYLFHIGLVEMLSYWKATCSPEIQIEAGSLNQEQLAWWKNLLIKGMGEYFYVNQIDFTQEHFVTIISKSAASASTQPLVETIIIPEKLNSLLIPIGGGKDSSVSLEVIKKNQTHMPARLATLLINPTIAAENLAELSGIADSVIVQRRLDPALFELHEQGYLNGHTPFSALAAFISALVADLWQLDAVAVSNERSSNEGNVMFHDTEINHQYSKTFEFEHLFQRYIQSYFPGSPHYFSFMRPLYELQIARLFASLTQSPAAQPVRMAFRSCNRGQKTNSWCGECSKCLFAYAILSPFISQTELETIFGKNILADESLWPMALELLGKAENKPLECVGTYEESLIAFHLSAQKIARDSQSLPALLAKIKNEILDHEQNLDGRAQDLLASWNNEHSVPTQLAQVLKTEVTDFNS